MLRFRSRIAKWNALAGLGVLILFAFGLRLYRLGEPSLWSDEGLTLYRAQAPWEELMRGRIVLRSLQAIETIDNHPPLYFATLKAWIALAGDSEFALRFPSVFASILLIPLAWAIGRHLSEPVVAWAGAALSAVSPLYLWYAQEARMYTLLALESAALLLLLLRLYSGEIPEARGVGTLFFILLVMILTHYTAFLLFPILGLWVLGQSRRDVRRLAALIFTFSILASPLIYLSINQWIKRSYFVPAFSEIHELFLDILKAAIFGFEAPDWGFLKILFVLIWVFVFLFGILYLYKNKKSIFIFLFIIPIAEIYIISYISPIYQTVRHLFLIIPLVYFIFCCGIALINKRFSNFSRIILVLITTLMIYGNSRYFLHPYPSRHDWRGALAWVTQNGGPLDIVILQDLALTPIVDYYYNGTSSLFLMGQGMENQEELVRFLERWPRPIERLWLITGLSSEALSRPEQVFFQWISRRGLYLTQKVFPGRNAWIRVLVYDFSSPSCAASSHVITMDIGFGLYFRLRGFELEPASPFMRARFFWEKGTSSSLNLWLGLRLVDETGTIWAYEIQPIWPSYPPDRWPVGQPVCQQVRLRLPPGLPPGHYRLQVEAFDLDRRIPAGGAPTWDSPPFFLEGHTDLPSVPLPVARSMGGLQLLSVQPEAGPPYFPGLGVPLRLLWRAETTPPAARSMALFWQQGATRRLLFRGALGPSFFPSHQWKAGQIIAQPLVVPLPPDLRGYGQIRMVLYDERGEEIPWETMWPFHRQGYPVFTLSLSPWPVRHRPIPLAREGRACFEGWICLDRYEIQPEQAAPGQTVEVRLAWHVRHRPERPGVVFVHLSQQPDQPPLATGDALPQGGQRPILTWEPGEYVEDIHRLPIPEDLPAGRYAIFVGWYSEEGRWRAADPSGARYPLDAVPLGEVEVRP